MVVAPKKNLKGTVTAGCDVEIMKDPLKERIEGGSGQISGGIVNSPKGNFSLLYT